MMPEDDRCDRENRIWFPNARTGVGWPAYWHRAPRCCYTPRAGRVRLLGSQASGDGKTNEGRQGGNDGASSGSGRRSGDVAGGSELRRAGTRRLALSDEPAMRVSLLPGGNLPERPVAGAPQGRTVYAEQPVRERRLRRPTERHQALQVMLAERGGRSTLPKGAPLDAPANSRMEGRICDMATRRLCAALFVFAVSGMLAAPVLATTHPRKPPHHPTKQQRPAHHPTKRRPAHHPTKRRPPHHPTKQGTGAQ